MFPTLTLSLLIGIAQAQSDEAATPTTEEDTPATVPEEETSAPETAEAETGEEPPAPEAPAADAPPAAPVSPPKAQPAARVVPPAKTVSDSPSLAGSPPPKHPSTRVRPVAEVRVDSRFDRITAKSNAAAEDQFDHRFTVPRAEVGMEATPHRRVHMRFTIDVVEDHPQVELTDSERTTGLAQDDAIVIDQEPSGWSPRLNDVYVDFQPWKAGDPFVRTGVQKTIVGSRNWFDEAEGSYYLVGPETDEVARMAGLVHDREIGFRFHQGLFKNRLAIDAMLANGTGAVGSGEDNVSKDVSLRVDGAPLEQVHLIVSGLNSVHGADERDAHQIYSFIGEWHSDHIRLMGEYVAGTRHFGGVESLPFVGGQAGSALDLPVGWDMLDAIVVTNRLGYFDPVADVVDAGAWLNVNASVQGWWRSKEPFGLMSGLGYGMWMPMDVTLPVEHSLVLQTLWKM